ncbi:hypothetical protein KSD_72690 [Ktedonobacter sp. SOSP1-85]|uniref:hypothetical protein n=1 Tax=Ktedonobacter sp. SOSP1-85 TaxID=2778367 RepID=UPI0019169438|nr:hypothetical protein [Ktedonobacter sp. SOSP1-85]GHO79498.1 hypothetical protein KSD_72690 [Ktedonobacter sp. SOSP1-85]
MEQKEPELAASYVISWYSALHPYDDIDVFVKRELALTHWTGLQEEPETDPNNAFLLIVNRTQQLLWCAHTSYWAFQFEDIDVEAKTDTIFPATHWSDEEVEYIRALSIIAQYLREIWEDEIWDQVRLKWQLGSVENDEPIRVFFLATQPKTDRNGEKAWKVSFDDKTVLSLMHPQKGFFRYGTVLYGIEPLVISVPGKIGADMFVTQPLWEKHVQQEPRPLLDTDVLEQIALIKKSE